MHRLIILSFVSLSCGLVAAETTSPEEIKGSVTRVIDGDTFFIRDGKTLTSVRLAGIDAPERGQPFATQAHNALKEILARKDLVIRKVGSDPRDKKILVTVETDGTSVNAEMVQEGWAWCVEEGTPDTKLKELQKDAQDAHRGLWADESPVEPWTYRAQKKEGLAAAVPAQNKAPKAKSKPKKKPVEPQPENESEGFESDISE
ncbi:thermonuclease family protein [Schlesneria sp.]|uniref:thermonuclease family protein n=1 Tax=Schlesneria sp. TaxID=2762018 RepID=UPI002F1ED2AA